MTEESVSLSSDVEEEWRGKDVAGGEMMDAVTDRSIGVSTD